jgi:hypothetical protein
MTENTVTSKNNERQETVEEKGGGGGFYRTLLADSDMVCDQVFDIQSIGNVLAVLREGVRDAVSADEINAWQGIVETILEQELTRLNHVLWRFSKNFEGIDYRPIKTDSLGRSTTTKSLLEEIEKGL